MSKFLTIASYVILIFGFAYLSWQFGRVTAETGDCRVYKALISGLMEPGNKKDEFRTKYKEYLNK